MNGEIMPHTGNDVDLDGNFVKKPVENNMVSVDNSTETPRFQRPTPETKARINLFYDQRFTYSPYSHRPSIMDFTGAMPEAGIYDPNVATDEQLELAATIAEQKFSITIQAAEKIKDDPNLINGLQAAAGKYAEKNDRSRR